MKLQREEKIYQYLQTEWRYNFEIAEEGLYILEISARAKNWLQNTLKLVSFLKDDDLAVKIDDREFPKLSGKAGLFDNETAWNGNKLKNLQQINSFFIYLNAGKHVLHFFADQSPLLETIKIYQATRERKIVLSPSKNYQLEAGNRRPWLNFILVDLALEVLKIQASANQKPNDDDDDLQLKINGERQKNDTLKSHKYWYWCGRILKGQTKTFDKKLNLAAGLHYIELWTDNTPNVDQIVFVLEEPKPTEGEVGKVALYTDITSEQESINLKAQPNTTSETLKQVPNRARIVIIKKAIAGEPLLGEYLSDLWHEVLYQGVRGFVHSSLIEIRGQERERIIEAIKTKAQELDINEKLSLNLAHCESKWLPFAHSKTDNRGIYQLGIDTIEEINKKHDGDISDPYDPYQNIDGGLKYLRYLLNRYEGSSDYLARVIAGWNAGPNKVSASGAFDLKQYVKQTRDLVFCTLEERRGENVLKYLKLLLLPLIIGVGLLVLFTSDGYKNLDADKRYAALVAKQEINYLTEGENFAEIDILKACEKEIEVGYLQTDLNGDKKFEKIVFAIYSPEPFFYYTNIYVPDGEKIIIDGSLWKAFVDDLTGDGIKELIVETIPGHISATYIFSYKNGRLMKVPIFDENSAEFQDTMHDENSIVFQKTMLATSLEIRFEDLDGDGVKEIILPIRNYGNEFIEPTYYYRWNGLGFILYDKKDIKLLGSD